MSESDDVLAANAVFYRVFANADAAGMAELWADSPDSPTVVHPGTSAICGRAEVLESWQMIFEGVSHVNIRFANPDAHLHGDVAIVLCTEIVFGHQLAATNVFRRTGSGWRLLHHHAGPCHTASPVSMKSSTAVH